LPSSISNNSDHWNTCFYPNGNYISHQGTTVPPTHRTHPEHLMHHPPPTVSLGSNITSTPQSDANMHPASNINQSAVGVHSLVQPFAHALSRAVAQGLALLNLTATPASQLAGTPGSCRPLFTPAVPVPPLSGCWTSHTFELGLSHECTCLCTLVLRKQLAKQQPTTTVG
jgi:hypothetical protein